MAPTGDLACDGQSTADHGEVDLKIKSALAEAQTLIDSRQYSKALKMIVEVVNMCPCDPAGSGKTRHGKDKTCCISQCVAAVKDKDPNALYKVATGPCACGYTWPTCTRPLHVQSLDALAECLEKGEQYVSAFATALSIIRLDPGTAVGYCRACRVLRYLLNNCSLSSSTAVERAVVAIVKGNNNPHSTTRLRKLLCLFVESGLHNTIHYRHSPKDTYDVVLQRMAYNLRMEIARRDPVKEFPAEISAMVFAQLDVPTLSRCLRVNKQWYRAVLGDKMLWAEVRLGRPGNPGRHLIKFLQRRQEITTFIIRDASDFLLTTPKLKLMLQGLPNLTKLCLHSGKSFPHRQTIELGNEDTVVDVPLRPAKLTELSAIAIDNAAPIKKMLELNVGTLQALDLINTGPGVERAFRTIRLPALKNLRIIEGHLQSKGSFDMPSIEMARIVVATPNLEKFHLDGFMTSWALDRPSTPDKNSCWQSLTHLVLGPNLRYSLNAAFAPWNSRFLPPLASTLRSIEILGVMPDVAHNVLFATDSDGLAPGQTSGWGPPQVESLRPSLPNLEVFRYIAGLAHPTVMRDILETAATNGNLKVLELGATTATGFPLPPASPAPAVAVAADFQPLRDYHFAMSENLHTLGLHDFNFHHDQNSRFGTSSQFDGQPFLDWIELFPQLHTVGVYPGQWEGVAPFIMRLIMHPRVKVIHQEYLKGGAWIEARQLAEKHGTTLLHTPKHMPAGWPMIVD